jgi:hypothetical protein
MPGEGGILGDRLLIDQRADLAANAARVRIDAQPGLLVTANRRNESLHRQLPLAVGQFRCRAEPLAAANQRDCGARTAAADQLHIRLAELVDDLLSAEFHVIAGAGEHVDVRVGLHQVLRRRNPAARRELTLADADNRDVVMGRDDLADGGELSGL